MDPVSNNDAAAVFTNAEHPGTHQTLGHHHGATTVAHRNGEEIKRAAIAGFDLTFSVPKSIPVLWALASRDVQQQVLAAHHDAVNEVLKWLEESAIHTRTGRGGVAHVATEGAIAAAFDHWESRARDPQLHTHVVIANRVQRASDGAWSTLDARTLYKATVAASEHYNGLLFDRLQERLGAVPGFRPPTDRGRNPRRELIGIDEALIHEFSSRSRRIDEEKDRLIQAWTQTHGRGPSNTTIVRLRQPATLSTRQAKSKDPQPLSALSANWKARAERLGFDPAQVVRQTVNHSYDRPVTTADLTDPWVTAAATIARQAVAHRRATWNRWNLLAEAERFCADIRCASAADRRNMIHAVATAAEAQCVPLNGYRYKVPLNASDDLTFAGHAVFEFHGARLYTDAGILANEQLVMYTRNDDGGPAIAPGATDTVLSQRDGSGWLSLAPDQASAAREVLCSGRFLDAVVGPAGSGKTTTMAAIRDGWEQAYGEGSVVGLAPASASAEVLAHRLGLQAENVAKWLYETVGHGAAQRAEEFHDLEATTAKAWWQQTKLNQRMAALAMRQEQWSFRPNQLVIVDEASMVSTMQLAALVHQARDAGAKIVLVGDPAQLDAIDAGGILGWLDRQSEAVQLTSVRRFSHEWEGPASLMLRVGDPVAIQHYAVHDRIQHGDYDDMVDQAYTKWSGDLRCGLSSILVAPDNETVAVLNERAHAELVENGIVDAERTVELSDGLSAGRGDTVIARKNDRHLKDALGDFIRNGTLIQISTEPGHDGSVTGRRLDTGVSIRLTSEYLVEAVELGYATTAHRSQGVTVDTSHTLLTQGQLTRELFYVGMTRGRDNNIAYVCETEPLQDEERLGEPESTWLDILHEVLAAQGAERAAHEVADEEYQSSHSLHQLAAEYDYLAQLAAADDLRATIGQILPGTTDKLQRSPSWGAGVAAWRRATAAQRTAAEATLEHALRRPGDAKDIMAVLLARLRLVGGNEPSHIGGWLEEDLSTSRTDVAEVIAQVRSLAASRIEELKLGALTGSALWTRYIDDSLPVNVEPADRNALMEHIAFYRDRWLIGDSPEPLGPPPADYEWERASNRRELETELTHLQNTSASKNETEFVAVPVGAALTNVGWEI